MFFCNIYFNTILHWESTKYYENDKGLTAESNVRRVSIKLPFVALITSLASSVDTLFIS